MIKRFQSKDRLRLELLETRTLLAGDLSDPYGLVADLNTSMHAVSGTGDFSGSFVTAFGNHRLVLTGTATTSLTIDLNQLPDFVTSLKISSFGEVNIVGVDHVDTLMLDHIGVVTAPGLSVTQGSTISNVGSLTIDSLGVNGVTLTGTDMNLTARSLDNTIVYSDLHSLTLLSDSREIDFWALNPDQTLNLKYLPRNVGLTGLQESSVHVVLPGVGGGTSTTTPPSSGSTETHTPDIPADNSPTSTDTSHEPNSDPVVITPETPSSADTGHLVIVSLPLDERTRALVDQLRDILHSSRNDSDQRVLDLLNHTNFALGNGTSLGITDMNLKISRANIAAVLAGSHAESNLSLLPLAPLSDSVEKSATPVIIDPVFNVKPVRPAVQAGEGSANQSSVISVPGVVSVDVSWPVVLTAPATELPRPAAASKSDEGDRAPASIGENVSALGSYIVERVSAEFSPGQQSLVLLVDPQPSRPANSNRKYSGATEPAKQDIVISTADMVIV